MHAEYDRIISRIKQAREANDMKSVKRWRNKLEKWQLQYGAYAPIK